MGIFSGLQHFTDTVPGIISMGNHTATIGTHSGVMGAREINTSPVSARETETRLGPKGRCPLPHPRQPVYQLELDVPGLGQIQMSKLMLASILLGVIGVLAVVYMRYSGGGSGPKAVGLIRMPTPGAPGMRGAVADTIVKQLGATGVSSAFFASR
mgnify:CR=1 FL=1|tara:strand:- start:9657 stop:10121 length:465 start_codon:yes stop_codon:yes gene_type:complete